MLSSVLIFWVSFLWLYGCCRFAAFLLPSNCVLVNTKHGVKTNLCYQGPNPLNAPTSTRQVTEPPPTRITTTSDGLRMCRPSDRCSISEATGAFGTHRWSGQFCVAAIQFDTRLGELGGQRLLKRGVGDDRDEDRGPADRRTSGRST